MDILRFLNLEYFFEIIASLFTNTGSGSASFITRFLEWWNSVLPLIKSVSIYVSLILLTLLIYAYIRFRQVKAEEDKKYAHHYEPDEGEFSENDRWDEIVALTNSENPNDWKQAILDADAILDDLVTEKGYPGVSLGEKLKSINPSNLSSIDSAWEAHKVRNKIAHDGGDFVLTQREAKRVINLFAIVFREFEYI